MKWVRSDMDAPAHQVSLSELVSQLKSAGVRLWVEDGSLCYAAPKPGLSRSLREGLAAHKAEICRLIEDFSTPLDSASVDRSSAAGEIPLTFEQERLWILHQIKPDCPAYNIGAWVTLRGRLDAHALRQALDEIVRRHEALRTAVAGPPFDPRVVILPPRPVSIVSVDVAGLPEDLSKSVMVRLSGIEMERPFDLQTGCLLRAVLSISRRSRVRLDLA